MAQIAFAIEDELHAEPQGEFATFELALAEIRRRALLPWDQPPNCAPCASWQTCGRSYEIVEYDSTQQPCRVIRRIHVLKVAAEGVQWAPEFEGS
jgi:hypothetical protein